ncbi:MAG TPA: nucleotidyltransferase domain-containing protein [Gemmatimonadaceae bacterium]
MATMTLDELVAQLRQAFGEGLRAVVLYGSAATGEHIAKRSDYNVLVLVDTIDFELLRREAAIARSWIEAGNPPPLTLTMTEWRASADVFPMEYADILERNRVLYGTPPFDGIAVERRDLRLQLEYQAMGKLLQLRQGILASGGDRKRLAELLGASVTTFMVLFRALLRYEGATPPTEYEALAREVGSRAGLDPAPFVRVIRHARGAERIGEPELMEVVSGYLAGVRRLAQYIDQQGAR